MIFVFRNDVILLTFHFCLFSFASSRITFWSIRFTFLHSSIASRQFPRQIPTSPIVYRSFPIVVRAIPICHRDWLIYKGFSPRSWVPFHPQFTKVPPVSYLNFTFLPVIYQLVLPVECYLDSTSIPETWLVSRFRMYLHYLNQFTILQNLTFSTD